MRCVSAHERLRLKRVILGCYLHAVGANLNRDCLVCRASERPLRAFYRKSGARDSDLGFCRDSDWAFSEA